MSESNRIKSKKNIFRAAKSIETGKLVVLVQAVNFGRESSSNKNSSIKAYVGMPDEELVPLEMSDLMVSRDGGSINANTELGALSIPYKLGNTASPFNLTGYLGNIAISRIEVNKLALLENSSGFLFATYNLPEITEETENTPSFRAMKI